MRPFYLSDIHLDWLELQIRLIPARYMSVVIGMEPACVVERCVCQAAVENDPVWLTNPRLDPR